VRTIQSHCNVDAIAKNNHVNNQNSDYLFQKSSLRIVILF